MSTLPLQVTFWIDYKTPSPLERGEGDFQAASQVS
jgi:hypothetical protein